MEPKTQIFCFHRVSDEFSPAYPPIPVKVFEKILSFIDRNYVVIPMEEIEKKCTSGKPRLIITFDDAYYDFYENALPLLYKFRFAAVQHVITNSATTGESFWTQKLNKLTEAYFNTEKSIIIPELQVNCTMKNTSEVEKTALEIYFMLLDRPDRNELLIKLENQLDCNIAYTKMMTWNELNECTKYCVSIGSHTHTHATLSALDKTGLAYELEYSRKLIRDNIPSSDCVSLAFPNGRYNSGVIDMALQCGYKYLMSTEPCSFYQKTVNNVLPRFIVYNKQWWRNYVKLNIYMYFK